MPKLILILSFCAFSLTLYAQNFPTEPGTFGGEYPSGINDAKNPCISTEQYREMEKLCTENIKLLNLRPAMNKNGARPAFSWPLREANGLNDTSYYFISNYVDQDPTSGIKDYNCGAVTYDGHRGHDIALMPFPFYKMDNNQVEVIAAAGGVIVIKVDGNFDKNCASNSLTPNYIVLQHADGSRSIYYHMKKNSLTSKKVGDSVATGDFLGVVGSSGSSTGPHLHFEVWKDSTVKSVNEPDSGSCNKLNTNSWWKKQKPYTEPAIVKAAVHSAAPVIPACPGTETPNEDSCLPLGAKAYFAIYIRNETKGLTADQKILKPDGTTFTNWVHNSTGSYLATYWTHVVTLPSAAGQYTYVTTYNGKTVSKKFRIDCTTGMEKESNPIQIHVFPNPSKGILNIAGEGISNGNCTINLRDILGRESGTFNYKIENNTIQKAISVSNLTNGIYLLTITCGDLISVQKVIIKNE